MSEENNKYFYVSYNYSTDEDSSNASKTGCGYGYVRATSCEGEPFLSIRTFIETIRKTVAKKAGSTPDKAHVVPMFWHEINETQWKELKKEEEVCDVGC